MSESEYYSGGGQKTIAKTVILKKYLNAYLSIMGKPRNWSGPKWYVDTHAGTGFTKELGVKLPGSALRALNFDFDEFHFYEKSPAHFDLLIRTIEDELDVSMGVTEEPIDGFPMARCQDNRIHVYNADCNQGVRRLIEEAPKNAHWFTFVDPERFSVERSLMESLCRRENMDILFNFQTSGFHRNARENAEHSLNAVEASLGDNFPLNGEPNEYVEWYKNDVFSELGWKSASRPMISKGDNGWRYDLIFASKNKTALRIIDDIYTSDLENDVMDEIREWRSKANTGQMGVEQFVHIPTECGSDEDDGQSKLGEF